MTACVKWQVCSKPLHNPTPNGLVGENNLLRPVYVPQSVFPYVTSQWSLEFRREAINVMEARIACIVGPFSIPRTHVSRPPK